MKHISEFNPDLLNCTEIFDLETSIVGRQVDCCKDQFAQLVFKGLLNDIENAEKQLKKEGITSFEKIVNLDGTAELLLQYICDAENLVAKYPLLKATGLCENWNTRCVECYYSESGASYFTGKKTGWGWYFDGRYEDGEGRWAYCCDVRKNYETSFEDIQCGELCKISYYFDFKKKWEDEPYIVKSNGKLYRYEPKPVVIVDETVRIPDGITTIDLFGFYKNLYTNEKYQKIHTLIIPESVTEIEVPHFGFSPTLSNIEKIVFEGKSRYMFDNGAVIDTENYELIFYVGKTAKVHVVNDSVKRIRKYAFAKYPLEKIHLNDNVEYIGEGAFDSCVELTSVNIPSKVKIINFKTFNTCKSLKEITIPSGVKTIRSDAFGKCKNLTIVAEIGSEAHKFALKKKINFKSINGDTETNANSNSSASSQIFSGKIFVMTGFDAKTEKLLTNQIESRGGLIKSSVVLNTDYLIVNPNYGSETTKLKRAKELNSKGKNIKILTEKEFYEALDNSSKLEIESPLILEKSETPSGEMIISGIDRIKDKAYEKNENITSVEIMGDVKIIGEKAFSRCKKIKKLILHEGIEKICGSAFIGIDISELVIPSSVKFIGDKAFANCKKLKILKLNEGLEEIGFEAFRNVAIEEVIIPSSVKRLNSAIGKGIFECSLKIKNITISNGIKHIPDYMFHGCQSVEKIVIPKSVKTLGIHAFDCYRDKTSKPIYIEFDGTISNYFDINFDFQGSISGPVIINCTDGTLDFSGEELVVPEQIKIINVGFFALSHAKKVVLPKNLEIIGEYAFSKSNITEITIPDSVKEIRKGAFKLSNISEIVIPNGIETIEYSLFGISKLKKITIPKSVKIIESFAFSYCEFETVYYEGSMNDWKKIVKKEYWNNETRRFTVKCSDGEIFE